MSYTQVFGGTTLYPSDVSYLPLALDADKALEWPLESNDPTSPAARIIDVTATGAFSVTLPNATQTGAGQTILFNNLPASTSSFTLKDFAGNTLATVGVGEQWQVYLASTSTAAGTWRVLRYGASTATVQASALAGYGLAVTSNTLSQSLPVTTFTNSPRTVLATDRASALVWTGTGTGTLNLPGAATVGNNFFIAVRNSGGGDLTVDPAGSETLDGAASLALRPGESAQVITDGLTWYTLGLGQEAVFAFDYTSVSVTGGNYTLSGSELNRIAYKFVGTLTSDCYVIVPSTVQQYWVDNATTGAYGLYLQTSGGAPVGVGQGTRGIYYCNGTNVVDADTATISLPVSAADGGTGLTNYAVGDILYASGTQALSRLADVAVGNALLSGGVGVVPSWGKIGLTTHVSGTLPVANGGSGAATLTGYLVGNGTAAFTGISTVPAADLSGTVAVTNGGTGQSSYANGQLLIGNSTGNTLAKATLTAGTGITITNGAGSITIANSLPLSDFTQAYSSVAPNDITTVASLTATGAAANIDAVFAAKGTGATLAQVPDSTATGGDKRGARAVDLQRTRSASTMVASGIAAVVGGGSNNTASGANGVVSGGNSNVASGTGSVVSGGSLNTASSTNATIGGGTLNTASAQYAAVLGGQGNVADGGQSLASGRYATTRGISGARVHSAGAAWAGGSQALGTAQTGTYVLRRQTTDATTSYLNADDSGTLTAARIVALPDNATYTFDVLVTARRTDAANESAGYRLSGVIDRQSGAGTTALVGTVTKVVLGEDTAAWDADIFVDTTNGGFTVQVTGEVGKTIRWVAAINTAEVVNG